MNKPAPEAQLIAAVPAHAMVLGALHALAFVDGDANEADPKKGITAQGNESWNAASIVATLSQPGVFGFVAMNVDTKPDPTPVGFVLARWVASESEILTLAVAPEAQRRGWGRRLISTSLAHAHDLDSEKMFLEVAADNAGAIALYENLGFKEVGRRVDYYRRQTTLMDALVMELSI